MEKNEMANWRLMRQQALDRLYENKNALTYQQYRTFKGQIKAGDIEGFNKGLDRILREKENK